MEKNENQYDRLIRVVAGIILLIASAFFYLEDNLLAFAILGIVGIVLLVTGATGFCLLYKLFNISTEKSKE